MMRAAQAAAAFALLALAACTPQASSRTSTPALAPQSTHPAPQRIVSLDYCTDQFVLKLADRNQIGALSPDADRKFSYMRAAARGLAKVRPSAEEVLARAPDLVVRYYGGGSNVGELLTRAGIPVVQLGAAEDFAGVRTNIRQMAQAFGHPDRGEALIAQMDSRLKAAGKNPTYARALYMSQGGVVAGKGTPIDEMLQAAGLQNFSEAPGWSPIPLESLAYKQPDFVAGAFFGSAGKPAAIWSAARHPVAQRQFAEKPSVMVNGAATACGGWFVVDAVEAMGRAAHQAGGFKLARAAQ